MNQRELEERVRSGRFVVPTENNPVVRRMQPTDLNTVGHVIDVAPTSQHIVEMRTSAVDRAKGFLISTVPLFGVFALAIVLASVFFFGVPFLSVPALVIFVVAFAGTWLLAYGWTLLVSAEGIAWYEARRKWDVVEREQTERWRYYRGE